MKWFLWSRLQKHGKKRVDLSGAISSGLLGYEDVSTIIGHLKGGRPDRAAEHLKAVFPGFAWKSNPCGDDGVDRSADDSGSDDVPAPAPSDVVPDKKGIEVKKADVSDDVAVKIKEIEAILRAQAELNKKTVPGIEALKLSADGSDVFEKPSWFDVVAHYVKAAAAGAHSMRPFLVGPRGCGKSRAMREVSRALGMDFVTLSFAGGARYSSIFGSVSLRGGDSQFELGILLEAISRPNTLIFIDEILSGDEDVSMGLCPLLDEPYCFRSPLGAHSVAQGSVIVGAANSTGRQVSRQYVGAKVQDSALLNRFSLFRVGYDDKAEKKIVKRIGGEVVSAEAQGSILKRLSDLREKSKVIEFDASTRSLISCVQAVVSGVPEVQAFEVAFLSALSPVERSKVGM